MLEWAENAISFRYTYTGYDATGKQTFWEALSSSPSGSVKGLQRGDYLRIDKSPRTVPRVINNFNLPASAFEFAFNDSTPDLWRKTNLGALRTIDWTSLAKRVSFVGKEKIEGKPVLVFNVKGGVSRFKNNLSVSYRVYVDPATGWFPIAWKTFDSAGALLCDYHVIGFSPGQKFGNSSALVPNEVEIRYYTGSPKGSQPEATNWVRFKYHNVVFNEYGREEEISLDPASARYIEDVANGVLIPVPK